MHFEHNLSPVLIEVCFLTKNVNYSYFYTMDVLCDGIDIRMDFHLGTCQAHLMMSCHHFRQASLKQFF